MWENLGYTARQRSNTTQLSFGAAQCASVYQYDTFMLRMSKQLFVSQLIKDLFMNGGQYSGKYKVLYFDPNFPNQAIIFFKLNF